jgi:hypothetical protein
VPSANARKAQWHQIHGVGDLFGIELRSKKAEVLPKITQQSVGDTEQRDRRFMGMMQYKLNLTTT